MILNIGPTSTDNFEITNVDIANKKLTVKRLSGSHVPALSESIYLENSRDNAWEGMKHVCDVTVGTDSLYGILTQTSWKPIKKAVDNDEPVSADLLDQFIDEIENESGETPNVIVASRAQYKKLKALKDDIETLPLMNRSKEFVLGRNIKHFVYDDTNIPIIKDNMIEDDRMYFLNTDKIKKRTAGEGGFIMNDAGKPFHSEIILGSHSLLVQFYVLGEYFIEPPFQGCISGLSTKVRA